MAAPVVLEDNPVAAPPVASVPGTQLEPSHFNISPTAGAAVVVSTSPRSLIPDGMDGLFARSV